MAGYILLIRALLNSNLTVYFEALSIAKKATYFSIAFVLFEEKRRLMWGREVFPLDSSPHIHNINGHGKLVLQKTQVSSTFWPPSCELRTTKNEALFSSQLPDS